MGGWARGTCEHRCVEQRTYTRVQMWGSGVCVHRFTRGCMRTCPAAWRGMGPWVWCVSRCVCTGVSAGMCVLRLGRKGQLCELGRVRACERVSLHMLRGTAHTCSCTGWCRPHSWDPGAWSWTLATGAGWWRGGGGEVPGHPEPTCRLSRAQVACWEGLPKPRASWLLAVLWGWVHQTGAAERAQAGRKGQKGLGQSQ